MRRSPGRVTQEVEAELAFHLERVAEGLVAQGWSPADAAIEARRRFGDLEGTRDYCREQDLKREQEHDRMTRLDELAKDLRYTLRSLRRAPGFTLVVLATLALGIGASTAIFSFVKGVLLEPLPFHEPDRLVRIWHENRGSGVLQAVVSEPDFLDWRRESRVAESMGAFFHRDGLSGVDLTGDGPPVRLSSALVGEGFFETLGTKALLGRTIGSDEQLAGRNRVVMLGHDNWRSRFNGDPSVIGRMVQLNGESFEVIGVMPEGFAYPADAALDAWLPLSTSGPENIGRGRRAAFQGVIARLRPGATATQLRAELEGIAARIAQEHPENRGWDGVAVASLRESIVGNVSRPLVLLLVAVLLVLLITCANVASLLLARATTRQRELAVRAALGAGRARITRQLLTESLLLALGGGALGVVLAYVAVRLVPAAGTGIPRAALVSVDATVLLFAIGISVLAGLLFGVVPALRATGASLDHAVRSGGRGSIGAGLRLRNALVVVQVSLAVVLVTVAALTTKSFARLLAVDLGFRPDSALFIEMSVSDRHASRELRLAYYDDVLAAIRRVPGVTATGAIRDLPTRGTGEVGPVTVAGSTIDPAARPMAQYHQVSTGFFDAMRIPVTRGRAFEARDRAGAPFVAIINEALAERAFPGEDPTDGRMLRSGTTDIPIIGVVGNVRQMGAAAPVEPTVYLHAQQVFRSRMSIVARTTGEPLALAPAVRRAIWDLDPQQTITSLAPLEEVLGVSIARPKLLAALFGLFGALGLSLGALGVYGVLAFGVVQRRQEIGVRMALGATPRKVQGMVVRQGLLLAGSGIAIGVAVALAATGAMQSVLFGIEAVDPMTYAQVVAAVVGSALLASWVPARRATSVDPAVALRSD